MSVRRITSEEGNAALVEWKKHRASRGDVTLAVRYTLEKLSDDAPGHAVEVRVPPAGAIQVVQGPRHTRGTPGNVVETDPQTWLGLVTGQLTWTDALEGGRLDVSGERADLSHLLPLDL